MHAIMLSCFRLVIPYLSDSKAFNKHNFPEYFKFWDKGKWFSSKLVNIACMIILGTKYIFLLVLDYLVIFGNTHRLWELMAEIMHSTQNGEKMGAVETGILEDKR